ncbi:MAG: ATP-binding protein, partial [Pseudonocardia sp.]|nr:ATP-binding protein [Pseudonocardia sp.]
MRESRETDEVLVCMAQRLQSQLERQLTLVERLQSAGGDDESLADESLADVSELRTSLLRSLRGSENLLVLGGAQQGTRARGPRPVSDVLADARAGVEDVSRVELGPAPHIAIAPRAVAALVALFTELLTHAVTVSPAQSRVEVVGRRTDDGGVTVEVVTDGPGPTGGELDELNRRLADRPIIDDIVSNRVGLFVAARLARRSGAVLRLQHRRGGPLPAHGLVAVVHCPPDLLD